MEMRRIVVFLPDSDVRACDGLAARYGSSRSEVVRIAVGEGMSKVRDALVSLKKLQRAEADAVAARRSATARKKGGRPAGSTRVAGVVPLDADAAIPQLVDYGRAARRVRPGLAAPELRMMMVTHAQVIGVLQDDLEDAVNEAVAKLFGDDGILPVADPTAPPE